MSASLWISWKDRVSLSAGDGGAVIAGPGARLALKPLEPELVSAFSRLAPPGEDEEQLAESILSSGSVDTLAKWYYHVDQFCRRGLVRRVLRAGDRSIATLVPFDDSGAGSTRGGVNATSRARRSGGPNGAVDKAQTRYVLSRFAYVRRAGNEFVLESPLAHARVILHDPLAMALIGALAAPATIDDLGSGVGGAEDRAALCRLIALLRETAMIDVVGQSDSGEPGGARGSEGQAAEPALESWEFHDLLFHSRSRRGRWDAPYGATYRLAHRPPPPALKSTGEGDGQELFRPDIERLMRDDPPLAQVTEVRRSVRQYGADPVTAKQLGEFLFRTARVSRHWQSEVSAPSGPLTMDFTARPYPCGGGLYELEVYLAVKTCSDVEPGLHYYDPQGHRLKLLCGATRDVEALLADAAASAGIAAQSLQVLVILAARFSRTAWKYESIAYALTLKHVGVVFQTMYLAATAMGLAPCAVGCGDSDLFARAVGTDYCVETSVGEFLLGSKE